MRKSKIKKFITRKLSTAQYESIDIHTEIEEEIEWETVDDRIKKSENISKILILDFIKTLNDVVDTLGIKKKIATVNSPKSAPLTENKDTKVSQTENFDFLEA